MSENDEETRTCGNCGKIADGPAAKNDRNQPHATRCKDRRNHCCRDAGMSGDERLRLARRPTARAAPGSPPGSTAA